MFNPRGLFLVLVVALLLAFVSGQASMQDYRDAGSNTCTYADCQASNTFVPPSGQNRYYNWCNLIRNRVYQVTGSLCLAQNFVAADLNDPNNYLRTVVLRNNAYTYARANTMYDLYCRPTCNTASARVTYGCYCENLCLSYGDCCLNQVSVCKLPELDAITPTSGATAGGYTMNLTGKYHFPDAPGQYINWGGKYNLTKTGADTSADQVWTTVTVPAGVGYDIPITLVVPQSVDHAVTKTSATQWFSYAPPQITSVTPLNVPTVGTTVTITGSNFGDGVQTSPVASQGGSRIYVNNVQTTMASINSTQITFSMPAGGATNIPLRVNIGGQEPSTVLIQYAGPVTTSMSPSNSPTNGGASITIVGTNFAASGATLVVAEVNCASAAGSACRIMSQNHTTMIFTTPPGIGIVPVRLTTSYGRTADLRQLSYDPPSISSWTVSNSKTVGGSLLTINGLNFYTNPTVQVGSNSCPWSSSDAATSATDNRVVCRVPAGEGVNLGVTLTTGANSITSPTRFSYDAPVITAVTSNNGPTQGGSTMTITGENFGISGVASVDNVNCASQTLTHTRILCVLPAGMRRNLIVRVTVAGRVSAQTTFVFNYDAPVITSVTPANAPTSGNIPITLAGSNFGTSGLVSVGDQSCAPTGTAFNQTSIVCLLAPGSGAGLAVRATVGSQVSNADRLFSYDPPTLTTFSPITASTSGGSVLTLTGTSFDTSGASVTIGSFSCAVTIQTHTQVQCTIPEGSGDALRVTLTNAGGSSIAPASRTFSYASPTVSTLSPVVGVTQGGNTLVVSGASFDTFLSGSSTVTIDGVACPIVSGSWTHSQLRCTTPPGIGAARSLRITARTGKFVVSTLFSYGTPFISGLTPSQVPTDALSGGSQIIVTISGANFGANSTTNVISFNSVNYTSSSPAMASWDHTQILFRVPAGQGASIPLLVRAGLAGAIETSNVRQIDYAPPTVTSVTPLAGPTQGGTVVTIVGTNFGTSTPSVEVGASVCGNIVRLSHTQITCQIPAGQGSVAIRVGVAGYFATAPQQFAYSQPVISAVNADSSLTGGGYTLTVTGASFGTAPSVLVGGKVCPLEGASSHTLLHCTMPEGEGEVSVVVLSGNYQSNSVDFNYGKPLLQTVFPSTGNTTGGFDVQLTGQNFGIAPTVRIGGIICPVKVVNGVPQRDHTQVTCVLPAGSGANLVAEVLVLGVSTEENPSGSRRSFTYNRPVITNVTPQNQATSGGIVVTITGFNFFTDGVATVGGVQCFPINGGLEHTRVRCTLPAGNGLNQPVFVTTGGQTNAAAFNYNYGPPVISSLAPLNLPTAGGDPLTISGSSFGSIAASGTITFYRRTSGIASLSAEPTRTNLGNCPVVSGAWFHSQTVCNVPVGMGLIWVEMTVTGYAPSSIAWSYEYPELLSFKPSTAPTWATQPGNNVIVTVTGRSFAAEVGRVDFARNQAGITTQTECDILSWNHTVITCQLPDGEGASVYAQVQTKNGFISSLSTFSYDAPLIDSVTPSNSPTVGSNIVIAGKNFGTSLATIVVQIGDRFCAVQSHTHIEIRCLSDAYFSRGLILRVTVQGQVSNSVVFDYDAPTLTSVTPSNGPTGGGQTITIGGTNFGTEPTATLGGFACTSPSVNAAHTAITCVTPSGSGINRVVQVIAGNQRSNTGTFNYDGPSITSVNPPEGATEGGYPITITGLSFGTTPVVTVGNSACPLVTNGPTSIVCTVPAGEGPASIRVAVGSAEGLFPTGGQTGFFYSAPVVTGITPSSGSSGGGDLVTIVGRNFGLTGAASFFMGGQYVPCTTQGALTRSGQTYTLTCRTPSGTGSNINVHVTVVGVLSAINTNARWSYLAPDVTSVSPASATSKGGTRITIVGTSFSPDATVQIDGKSCPPASVSDVTFTRIVCIAPAGAGTDLFVQVSVNSLSNTRAADPEARFGYSAPAVTSFSPQRVQTDGSSDVTIAGTNFGSNYCTGLAPAAPIQVNGADCVLRNGEWDHEQVVCRAPPGSGYPAAVRMCFQGTPASPRNWVTIATPQMGYAVPTITAVTQATNTYNTDGTSVITIVGTNLGYPGITPSSVTVQLASGAVDCPLVSSPAISSTAVSCTLPAGTADTTLKITVSGQESAPSPIVKRDLPLVSGISGVGCDNTSPATGPKDCPLTSSVRLTVTGSNFGPASGAASYLGVKVGSFDCTFVAMTQPNTQFTCDVPVNGAGGNDLPVTITTSALRQSTFTGVSYTGPIVVQGTLRRQGNANPASATPTTVSLSSTQSTDSVVFHVGRLGTEDVNVLLANSTVRYGVAGSPAQFTCSPLSLARLPGAEIIHAVTCGLVGGIGSALHFQLTTVSGDFTLVSNVGTDSVSFPAPTFVRGTIKLNTVPPPDTTTYSGILQLISPVDATARVLSGEYTEGEYIVFRMMNIATTSTPTDTATLTANAALLKLQYGTDMSDLPYGCFDPVIYSASNPGQPSEIIEVVKCRTAPGSEGPYSFTASSNGAQTLVMSEDKYRYPTAPKVLAVRPVTGGATAPTCVQSNSALVDCSTLGGEVIEIYAEDVATDMDLVFVFVGGNECRLTGNPVRPPGSSTAANIRCTLPPGVGVNQAVTVSSSALWSEAAPLVSYAYPAITSIVGCPAGSLTIADQCARAGSTPVTLTGQYFGPSDALVLVGGTECTGVVHSATTPQTSLTCSLPPGTNLNLTVKVIQNMGLVSSSNIQVSYIPCPAGAYADPDPSSSLCLDCAGGTYTAVVGAPACTDCAPGSFATGPAATGCDACAPGSASGAGASACGPCVPGEYADLPNSPSCTACSAGKFSAAPSAATCTDCNPGFAQTLEQQIACDGCTAGNYQSDFAQASCRPCNSGFATDEVEQSECTPCQPGWSAPTTGMSVCEECGIGLSQALSGQSACQPCASGTFAATTGQATCTPCATGSFSVLSGSVGASECTQCAAGSYQDRTGQSTCLPCPLGTFSDAGATTCTPCDKGFYQDEQGRSVCKSCAGGKYADVVGTVNCIDCQAGRFSTGSAETCTFCAAGTFQPTPAQASCNACPDGTATANTGQVSCSVCADGKYTDSTTPKDTCQSCAAGRYSARASGDPYGPTQCQSCQNGRYAPATGSASCLACNPGTVSTPARDSCTVCTAGTFANTATSLCEPCAVGSYSAAPGSMSCTACSAGTYANTTSTVQCTSCETGKFQPNTGTSFCDVCALGSFAGSPASIICTDCPPGRIADVTGLAVCKECAPGSFQANGGSTVCDVCANGSYQDALAQNSCKPCSAGSFSAGTTAAEKSSCTSCGTGHYSAASATACTECAAGSYAVAPGSSSCDSCDAGKFAANSGQSSCDPCPQGEFQSNPGRTDCVQCQPGRYSSSVSAVVCTACEAGSYSLDGFVTCSPCDSGTYSSSEASVCTDCVAGKFALGQGNYFCNDCGIGSYGTQPKQEICTPCEAGSYQGSLGMQQCDPCQIGYATPFTGQSECQPCEVGKFSATTGSQACEACGAGRYSDGTGSEICFSCQIGRYQDALGQTICDECEIGKYTDHEETSSCTLCEEGKFQDSTGNLECKFCGLGTVSPSQGAVACEVCDFGKFQNSPGQTVCIPCEAGTASNVREASQCAPCATGSSAAETGLLECTTCEAGRYADEEGLTTCKPCSAGFFQAEPGQDSCRKCATGQFSDGEAFIGCKECPLGTYADGEGTTACEQCGLGTYAGVTGKSACERCALGSYAPAFGALECVDCGPGTYSDQTGMSQCSHCDPGYSQPNQGAQQCEPCQPGRFTSSSMSASCEECPLGTYTDQIAQQECTQCQAGKYSSTPSQGCFPCASGTYAAGNRTIQCEPCPIGHFSVLANGADVGAVSCTPCEPGYSQASPGMSVCDECGVGRYSPSQGSPDCTACSSGSYMNATHASVCDLCAAGRYSYHAGSTGATVCTDCAVGTAQASQGQSQCLSCSTGRVAANPGSTVCASCDAGRYADQPGRSVCQACNVGSATPIAGTSVCPLCSAGRFSTNLASLSCTTCAPGTYQSFQGMNRCNVCPIGYYADAPGQAECRQCEAGKIGPQFDAAGDLRSMADCFSCPPGQFQSGSGQTVCSTCPVGTYAESEGSAICLDCQPGHYAIGGASLCSQCDPGQYQPDPRQTTCYDCAIGKYTGSTGQGECADCEVGKYGTGSGQAACTNCAAGSYNAFSGRLRCELCDAGRFAREGQGECTTCADGTATSLTGSGACASCGSLAISAQDRKMCLCKPGYYLPFYRPGSNVWACTACPTGANCLAVGTTWQNLEALPGYWRPSNSSTDFIRCPIPEQCTGGPAAAEAFTDDGASGSGCAENRAGIACSHCVDGYRPSGKTCISCPDQKTQWIMIVFIGLVIVIAAIVSVFVIIRTGDRILQARTEDNAAETGPVEDVNAAPAEGRTGKVAPLAPPAPPVAPAAPSSVEMAPLGADAPQEESAEWSASDFEPDVSTDDDEADNDPLAQEQDLIEMARKIGPPPPVENFTYKFKIFISFLQITYSLTNSLDFRWPDAYKDVMTYIGISNLDFLFQMITGTDCFTQDNYYIMYLIILLVPIGITLLILLFWVLPREANILCWRHVSPGAKTRNAYMTWRVFLYFLFLIYPATSSTVLRHYVCVDVDGVSFLETDMRVKCYTELWNLVSYLSTTFILLYPVGIPAFFFILLRKNRNKLQADYIKAQLGFLYAGYKDNRWWWEIVDSIHKLFLVALIAFFPHDAQLPVAMSAIILYLVGLLLLNPYADPSDDTLHQIAQVELFLIVLAGYMFESFNQEKLKTVEDVGLSIVLLALTFGFIALFLVFCYIAVRRFCRSASRRRAEKKAHEDALAKEEEDARLEEEARDREANEAAERAALGEGETNAPAEGNDDTLEDSDYSSSGSGSGSEESDDSGSGSGDGSSASEEASDETE